MSAPLNAAPTAAEWRDAFYAVEGKLNRLESMIKVADFLAGMLIDDADERGGPLASIAQNTALSVFHVVNAMKEADDAYYEAFNDLVGRENAALLAPNRPMPKGGA